MIAAYNSVLQEQIEDTASRVDLASVHSQQLEKKIKQFDKVVNFHFGCLCILVYFYWAVWQGGGFHIFHIIIFWWQRVKNQTLCIVNEITPNNGLKFCHRLSTTGRQRPTAWVKSWTPVNESAGSIPHWQTKRKMTDTNKKLMTNKDAKTMTKLKKKTKGKVADIIFVVVSLCF